MRVALIRSEKKRSSYSLWLTSIAFFFLTFLLVSFNPSHAKVTSTNKIFLPDKEGLPLQEFQKTPISWWNFLFYDSTQLKRAEVCDYLEKLAKEALLFNPCGDLPLNQQWLQKWSKENLLHSKPPTALKKVEKSFNKALVQLSFPLPAEQLEILRTNPLVEFSKLEAVFSRFFHSAPSGSNQWRVLPLLFNYPPSQVKKTDKLFKEIPRSVPNIHWVGPHIGTFENQQTITKDIKKVLAIGTLLLGTLFFFLIIRGRMAYLFLLPILFISSFVAYLVVHWSWGSIHGLTLAFGSGLIGISMDYAFHGWKTKHNRFLWRTNGVGFMTTFGAFVLLTFFSIPLIKQISLFTSAGLACAFILSFSLSRFMDDRWKIRPLWVPRLGLSKKSRLCLLLLFLGITIYQIPNFNYDFSLKKMDYSVSLRPEGITDDDLFDDSTKMGFLPVSLKSKSEVIKWSQKEDLPILGAHSLFSNSSTSHNLKDWIQWSCPPNKGLGPLAREPFNTVFRDFFDFLECNNLKSYRSKAWNSSSNLFKNQGHELFILKAQSPNEFEKIKKQWPKTFFISEFADNFSRNMEKDTFRYLIIILLFVSIFLALFFKRSFPLVILPTVGGILGLVLLVGLSGRPATFMTFMGLLILLGLTLDYGIFCTAFIRKQKPLGEVFGAVTLSALTSICGFAPLAFCTHPVLRDLGGSIIFGLMGACFVTFFTYPIFQTEGVEDK